MKIAFFAVALSLFALPTAAQTATPVETPPREAILHQQMHAYLDTLIELQLRLQKQTADSTKREADWAEYSKPLWADSPQVSNAR